MRFTKSIETKIFDITTLQRQIAALKATGKTIAFTNGCFDILHQGHIYSLSQAASEADYLIVAVNSDDSVKRLGKGDNRPVNNETSRAILLASLSVVDAVIIFNEDTPQHIISKLLPDVLVKGGDYTIEQIAGAKEVINNGGRVVINKIIEGFSTTNIINKLQY
ncbi:MAG: D-glycero-beta-D-manno-heptose 1-phosphate adenylyltransferase [Chitinophagaceae bacterium]